MRIRNASPLLPTNTTNERDVWKEPSRDEPQCLHYLIFVTPDASVHHLSLPLLHLSRCGTKIGTFSFSNKSPEFRFENSTWPAMSYNMRVSKLPRSCRETKTNRRVHEPTRFCSSNRYMLCPQSQGWHTLSDFHPLMETDCSPAY